MQKQLAQVATFQRAFGQNVEPSPTLINKETARLRYEQNHYLLQILVLQLFRILYLL